MDELLRGLGKGGDALGDQVLLASVEGGLFSEPAPKVRVGRYVLHGLIGSGGMGRVYRAYDPELDREVALKKLRQPLAEPTAVARMRREAQAMARLSHPNVLPIYDFHEERGELYIAMEYVEGITLRQWLDRGPHPWAEVLKVFVQAGAGLAAAHAADVVHRDFKPGNVMLGADGRARVLDFGLARAADEEDDPEITESARLDANHDTPDPSLTMPGAVVGTPVYMAPEQHLGSVVGPACDQYAFCVTLWEALYGVRPFVGTPNESMGGDAPSPPSVGQSPPKPPTPPALSRLTESRGRRRFAAQFASQSLYRAKITMAVECPEQSDVPSWLERIVFRGMSPNPARRFRSMEHLLAALARRRDGMRRWWVAGLASALVLGTASWGLHAGDDSLCEGARAQLAEAWDPDRAIEVRVGLEATGVDYASGTATRVVERLDAYADAWMSSYTDACTATGVDGEQSAAVLDLRMRCLERRRTELGELVGVLSHATASVVPRAVEATAALGKLDRCADVDALGATVAPPDDPAVAREVASLRQELARARILGRAGVVVEALEIARDLEARSRDLDYHPFEAEAKWALADALDSAGDHEAALAAVERAYALALEVGDDGLATESAILAVFVLGEHLGRYDEAKRWGRDAEALIDRIGGDMILQARLLSHLGSVARAQADLDTAATTLTRAVELYIAAAGPKDVHVANTLNTLGVVRRDQGRLEEAEEHLLRALGIMEAAIGDEHPSLGFVLNNLGIVYGTKGDHERAHAFFARGLRLSERVLGERHPAVAHARINLGISLHSLGRYEDALVHLERGAAVFAEHAISPLYAGASRFALAQTLWDLGRERGRAVRLAEAALLDFKAGGLEDGEGVRETEAWLAERRSKAP